MKLIECTLHPVHLDYLRPVRWHSSLEDGADFLLLRLVGDDGHVGVAEATAKPTWSGTTLRVLTAAMEELFLPRLMGVDAIDEHAVDRAIGRIPDNQIAKVLIHGACSDLRASAEGRPPWRRWDGDATVRLSWTIPRRPPAEMAREAAEMVGRHGFGVLKVKGGQGPETDFEVLSAIGAAVGDGVELYVDANGAYPRDQAFDYVKGLADRGVVMIEDPYFLSPDEDFRKFQSACPLPVLVDFACASPRDGSDFLDHGARALSIKPGRIGFRDAWRLSDLARARGAQTVVGLFGETDLGTLANAQIPAALPERDASLPAELSCFLMMKERLLRQPIDVADGVLRLPDEQGLAHLVDWDRVERLRPA